MPTPAMLRVALLQAHPVGSDVRANAAKGRALCRSAKAMGADLALFPEMWSCGYQIPFEGKEHWRSRGRPAGEIAAHPPALTDRGLEAVPADGEFVNGFRALARELDMAIAITYLEEWPGAPRNTVTLFDRHGHPVLTYAKVHTCDFGPEWGLTPGDDFVAGDLGTAAGPVRVGAMICFDREFPESARLLMLEGAELVLTPNACTLEHHRLAQFQARATENTIAVAMTNYPAPEANGHSVAYHPVAFDGDGNSQDILVVEAGAEEGIFLATFDLEAIRRWRGTDGWGVPWRKPHRYGGLAAVRTPEAFRRVGSAGEGFDPGRR